MVSTVETRIWRQRPFNLSLDSTLIGSKQKVLIVQALRLGKTELASRNWSGNISWRYLRNISKLEVMDLSGNSLQGQVPKWFWTSPSLLVVNLTNNRFGRSIALKPTSQNASFSSLQTLNLSYNKFTNLVQLSGFSNLQSLDLSHNKLSTFSYGFQKLTTLHHLNFSSYNIKGNIKSISFLHSLTYLDLSNNNLNGSFPSDFPLNTIKFLSISHNNFKASVILDRFKKLGKSTFIHAGNNFNYNASNHPTATEPPPNYDIVTHRRQLLRPIRPPQRVGEEDEVKDNEICK